MQKHKQLTRMIVSALCLALCYVLPNFTGSIPQIGSMLLPMHLPVFLCGFLCGGPWGLAVGFIAPIMRSALVGMPVMYPMAVSMAFELATYGFFAGFFHRRLPKNLAGIYGALILSMIAGRLVYGGVQMLILLPSGGGYTLAAFMASTLTGSIPGILLQLILIPVVVRAIEKSNTSLGG